MKIKIYCILFILFACNEKQKPVEPEYNNPFDYKNDSTPFTLDARIDNGGITLNWSKVEISTLESYRLYKSISEDSNYKAIGTFYPDIFKYIDTNIENGQSYWYYVSAINNTKAETTRSNRTTVNIKTEPVLNINGGDTHTNSTQVNLTILAHSAQQMILSNTDNFNDSEWEDYATTKIWNLAPGLGLKAVYLKVKYEDFESDTVHSEIMFDSIAPSISLTVTPDSGITNETIFYLDPTGSSDNLCSKDCMNVHFDYENDGIYDTGWQSASLIYNEVYDIGGGDKTIKMQLTDGAWIIDTTSTIFVNTRPFAFFKATLDMEAKNSYYLDAELSNDYEDGELVQNRWDFNGDGIWDTDYVNDVSCKYKYTSLGKFSPKLEVIDTYGLSGYYSLELTIKPEIEYEQILNNTYKARAIRNCGNGEFIIAGSVSTDNGEDIWLMKIDSSGNFLWEKTFDGTDFGPTDSIFTMDYAYDVQVTSDGGYIIMGTNDVTHRLKAYFWLIKTDENGNKEWDKKLGGEGYEYSANSIKQTDDFGYIMSGSSMWKFKMIKSDMNGLIEWEKDINDFVLSGSADVELTNDGGYVSTGYVSLSGSAEDFYLVKTDALGNIIWDKTYGGSGSDRAEDVLVTNDNGYLIVGNTNSYGNGGNDIWLLKTDIDGNILWNKTFGGIDDDEAYDIHPDIDGGYLIAGCTESFGTGSMDFWVFKIDSNGNLEWDQTTGGSDVDFAFCVSEISTDKYFVVGNTRIAILK
ncbi:MAG: hypothetical protein JXR46_15720 [Calditrichaceae bacterium]|nr:hypothetical protein [Calditrichaceae bacterium]MBN2710493.1 hypothetical protein [Calditrichaceae bacterium]RQV97284.1 MAG: hypothetical protein EH224_01700 [Calditrichota bacterium]